jgi:hypothetical protein
VADYSITAAEVLILVPSATPATLTEFIALVDGVDACLEGQGVTEGTGKSLKRLAVAHMATLTLNSGRGVVTSESVPAGSRGFAAWKGTGGLEASPFGSMLKGLDWSGCLTFLFDADGASGGPRLFLGTAGT